MVTNNEAVENFLNGKRNLAAYQFSQLMKESSARQRVNLSRAGENDTDTILNSLAKISITSQQATNNDSSQQTNLTSSPPLPSTSNLSAQTQQANTSQLASSISEPNSDEIAFNYAMVNLFTGCPGRASIIFTDLVRRYPRNPRLWLRLAESMLASERSKLSEFEHIQQLADPRSRDHLIKIKNNPILIKINPNYCQQQLQQKYHNQRRTHPNFLITIKSYLNKSLDLINEYNDISLLTDDIPINLIQANQAQQQHGGANPASLGSSPLVSSTSLPMGGFTNNISVASSSTLPDSRPQQATPMKLSPQLSYANPYQSISRSALYHLRNKVQLNLAYICLCMGEPVKALNYTTQCLKSSPQGYEKVLASLYHAEACILASRIDEAIQFLNLEVLNMAKRFSQDLVAGDTKRVVFSDDMQHQFDSGALASVVTYNLSVAYAAKGEFSNAQKILTRCIQPTKPSSMPVMICLLYVQLQQGQLESAKRTILSNLPQFR